MPDHFLLRKKNSNYNSDADPLKTYQTKEEKERLKSSCYAIQGGNRCTKGKDHEGEHSY